MDRKYAREYAAKLDKDDQVAAWLVDQLFAMALAPRAVCRECENNSISMHAAGGELRVVPTTSKARYRCCTEDLVCMQPEGAGFCSRHGWRSSPNAQSTRPGRRPSHKRCPSPRGGSTLPSSIATSGRHQEPGPILSWKHHTNAGGRPWMQLCILVLEESCTCQAATASQQGWLHAAKCQSSDPLF